jgi:HAD superfamily hydrolase (TIGR01509 family)
VDSEPIANRLFTAMANELGANMTEEENNRLFRGRSMKSCHKILCDYLGREIPESFFAVFHKRFYELLRVELKPIEGIHDALARIPLRTCVASSGSHDKMRLTLGLTKLWDYFEGRIFSADEVPRGKPFPDLFLHAAKTMGVDPSRCAVIEDSLPGLEAAQAAGMTAFAYIAENNPTHFQKTGATLFHHMRELPGLLL